MIVSRWISREPSCYSVNIIDSRLPRYACFENRGEKSEKQSRDSREIEDKNLQNHLPKSHCELIHVEWIPNQTCHGLWQSKFANGWNLECGFLTTTLVSSPLYIGSSQHVPIVNDNRSINRHRQQDAHGIPLDVIDYFVVVTHHGLFQGDPGGDFPPFGPTNRRRQSRSLCLLDSCLAVGRIMPNLGMRNETTTMKNPSVEIVKNVSAGGFRP